MRQPSLTANQAGSWADKAFWIVTANRNCVINVHNASATLDRLGADAVGDCNGSRRRAGKWYHGVCLGRNKAAILREGDARF